MDTQTASFTPVQGKASNPGDVRSYSDHNPSNVDAMDVSEESDTEDNDVSGRPRKVQRLQAPEKGSYACEDCGKDFKRPSDLKKHSKYHLPEEKRPFACDKCLRRFVLSKDLERHKQTQHGVADLECNFCSKRYTRRDLLNRHLNSAHFFEFRSDSYGKLHNLSLAPRTNGTNPLVPPKTTSQYPFPPHPPQSSPKTLHRAKSPLASTAGLSTVQSSPSMPVRSSTLPYTTHYSMTLREVSRPFEYAPLSSPRTMRILCVLPGAWEDPLVCYFDEIALGCEEPHNPETRDYEAVSWHWGERTYEHLSIQLDGEGVYASLRVRSRLISILKGLRLVQATRRLWIDQPCICRDFPGEVAFQIASTPEIYAQARSVCVWLGENRPTSNMAFNFIRQAAHGLDLFPDGAAGATASASFNAFVELMRYEWFSRLWMVPEIAFARNATLHCGSDQVDWADFEVVVSLFEQDPQRLLKLSADDDAIPAAETIPAVRLVQVISSLFCKDDENKIIHRRFPLKALVVVLSGLSINVVHDRIYAVLSLAKDSNKARRSVLTRREIQVASAAFARWKRRPKRSSSRNQDNTFARIAALSQEPEDSATDLHVFHVDYEQAPVKLFQQFIDFATRSDQHWNNLDILCQPWAPIGENLPSWCTTSAQATFETRSDANLPGGVHLVRTNHDSLTPCRSLTVYGVATYNACRFLRATELRFGNEGDTMHEHSLFVAGFVVDRIEEIEVYSQFGSIPAEWFDLADWKPWERSEANERPPQSFWRTLVADRGPGGAEVKPYYPMTLEKIMKFGSRTTGLDASSLEIPRHGVVPEFVQRMISVIWNRKLFKSGRYHLLGLAPKQSKRGDVICIFKGCSVPVVLRPQPDQWYTLIGECYLDTMMDGRAVDIQEAESIPFEEFEIR